MNTNLKNTISQENWQQANRNLMAKTIAELMHEELLKPTVTFENKEGFTIFLMGFINRIKSLFIGISRMEFLVFGVSKMSSVFRVPSSIT